MWMHCAGHAVLQQRHATHRGEPSNRWVSRWIPRKRSGYSTFSSGYRTVAISLSFMKVFLKKRRIVTPSPFAISGTNACSEKVRPGLGISFAIVPSPPQQDQDSGRQDVQERQRQDVLPAD